jgi:hypothetical protein
MARPLRLEAEGAVYHVIARGNERKAVFRDDRDRQEYLDRLIRCRERFGLRGDLGTIVCRCITAWMALASTLASQSRDRSIVRVRISGTHDYDLVGGIVC